MTSSPTKLMSGPQARRALRSAFVARLVRRMQQTGVMATLFRVSFDASAVRVFPPHLCAPSVLHATLKPLCRSGVAAGGAGGGGPGHTRTQSNELIAATVLPLAA